jgi:hypothetical protein
MSYAESQQFLCGMNKLYKLKAHSVAYRRVNTWTEKLDYKQDSSMMSLLVSHQNCVTVKFCASTLALASLKITITRGERDVTDVLTVSSSNVVTAT